MRLTKDQAAILGAYTGILLGRFADLQAYAEKVLERPVMTHEFADKAFNKELREATKADLLALVCDMQDEEVS